MKKNYNSLNEEINRMKSLFSEDRLYGNLVEKDVISEQKKFFSNLTDAFKVTLKSFDDLDTFSKFINKDISRIDDIINHVDEFEGMWKIVSKNLNTTKLKSNLQKLKTLIDSDKLKNIPEDQMKIGLNGFPKEGGMQEMVFDFWLESKGIRSNLPQKVETRLVKTDPTTGELVIGTVNQKGMVTYKNKRGEVVLFEKDPNIKVDDSRTNIKSDIEDVDFIEVKPDTPLDDLNGKTVAASEENIKNVVDSVGDKIADETKNGNKVVFTITGEGDEGVRAAQEMMDNITNNKGGVSTADEVLEGMAQEVTEKTVENFEVVKNKLKNKLKNLTWGTRFWWNPLTIMEKTLSEKWGKNLSWSSDPNRFINSRFGKVLIRFIIIGTTYEVGKTIKDPDRDFWESGKNNLFVNSWEDLTSLIGSVLTFFSGPAMTEMGQKIIEDTLMGVANVDVTVVKQKVITKAMDELNYINSNETNEDGVRKSTFTCTKLSEIKSDDEVVKFIIEKHSEKGIVEELESIREKLGGTGTDDYKETGKMLRQYFNNFISISTEINELKEAIGVVRTQCEVAAKQQEEIDKIDSKDYEITIESGVL